MKKKPFAYTGCVRAKYVLIKFRLISVGGILACLLAGLVGCNSYAMSGAPAPPCA